MADPIIFHADCNNFFASCECLERPELRKVPMAVAGDPQKRVGVVVAKNELAKKYGVKTTDTVYQAKQKCPGIVFVPPRHDYYRAISRRVNGIYLEYTGRVEPASIDESYLDMTEAVRRRGIDPRMLADELRSRVRSEIGITISVGVSFCKVFAKMGSDYKKPDATTLITRENYRELLWPLPVSELLFAGRSTVKVLAGRGISTIGDLARRSERELAEMLGKHGGVLWRYANGIDQESVRSFGDRPEAKSVSHGHTFDHDLVTEREVRGALCALVDEVARSLRRQEKKGSVVTLTIRRPDMTDISRQITLDHATFLQHEIQDTVWKILAAHWQVGRDRPIRALTVSVGRLVKAQEAVEQTSLFDWIEGPGERPGARERTEKLEAAVDALRRKYGDDKITLGYRE